MKETLILYVGATCRTDLLGDRIELPYSKELEDAIMTINSICSDKVEAMIKEGNEKQKIRESWKKIMYFLDRGEPLERIEAVLGGLVEYGKENK